MFDERELIALDYADAMTNDTADEAFVTEELFAQVAASFTTEEIVELTELIAWENASARFNRALGVQAQGLWERPAN